MSRTHPIAAGTAVTSGFRTKSRPDHNGTDFRASTGTPVHASQGGTAKIGYGHPRAGNWIEITNGNTVTGYSHLSDIKVANGQKVTPGQIIGESGATGNVTGPHLHFYTKVGGKFTDPVTWLATTSDPPAPVPTPAPGGTAGNLRRGSTGPRVARLRAGLRRVFPSYKRSVDVKRGQLLSRGDVFDEQTEAWVKEFQDRVGIESDGVVGPITTDYLARYGVTL